MRKNAPVRTSECFWWFTFVYRGPHTNQKAKLVKPTHGRLFGFHDVIRNHTRSPKLRTCPGRKIAQIKMTNAGTLYFIILVTGVVLHGNGRTDIQTSKQAAEALRPLAGSFASTLYAMGIIGVGFLSIPTLAGSAAYAFAETFAWKQGMGAKPKTAWRFYTVFALSMAAGMTLY